MLNDIKKILRFKPGEVLVREGDIDDGWYILIEGKVGVFKKEIQIGTFQNKGIIFGELSGILNLPRTATLKSLDHCQVLHINAKLDDLIRLHPDVVKKIVVNMAERLVKTTDDLWLNMHKKGAETPDAAESPAAPKKKARRRSDSAS